ncbi:Uncharacterised protein [Legionella donaldsonii]|uniref:Transmembrane protein n=1 Tax=Legionella donaldsonii TaxID=45060 RepID=A0A378IYZ8_9GAMM|nr:bacteriophage holin [Legionella donaldsonii]STX40356.1 Uncharacterised protein [Legionella donaldsonii]
MTNCRLSPMALGLALGILWGISIFLMGIIAYYSSYGQPFVAAMGSLYVGYQPSILGSVIGGIIGFIDAFIGGVILAWLYNLFAHCCCKKSEVCAVEETTIVKAAPKPRAKKTTP